MEKRYIGQKLVIESKGLSGQTLFEVYDETGGNHTAINLTTPNINLLGSYNYYTTNTAISPDFLGKTGFQFNGGTNNAARQFQIFVGDDTTPKVVTNGSGFTTHGNGFSTLGAVLGIKSQGNVFTDKSLLIQNQAGTGNHLEVTGNQTIHDQSFAAPPILEASFRKKGFGTGDTQLLETLENGSSQIVDEIYGSGKRVMKNSPTSPTVRRHEFEYFGGTRMKQVGDNGDDSFFTNYGRSYGTVNQKQALSIAHFGFADGSQSSTPKMNFINRSGFTSNGPFEGFHWFAPTTNTIDVADSDRQMWLSSRSTLSMFNGLGPSTYTAKADSFQTYSADIAAGNAAPHFRTENGDIVRIYAAPDWVLPTGVLTRTTFDPSTVTLSALAERVAALITDLTSGHGLLKETIV